MSVDTVLASIEHSKLSKSVILCFVMMQLDAGVRRHSISFNGQPWQTASHYVLIFSPQIGSHGRLRHIPSDIITTNWQPRQTASHSVLYYHHKLAATADCVTFHSYIFTTNCQPVSLRYFLFKLSLGGSYSLILLHAGFAP